MKEKLNKELEEINKKIKKNELIVISLMIIYGIVVLIEVTNIFPLVEKYILVNNLNNIQSFFINASIIIPSIIPSILIGKKIIKTADLRLDKYLIEDDVRQQEIINKLKIKFEKLSKLQQEKIIQYISSYDDTLEEIFLDIDELDREKLNELKIILTSQRENSENTSSDSSSLSSTINLDLVDYVINEIDAWSYDLSEEIIEVILDDIKYDKNWLIVYFPEIEWDSDLLNIVYDRLFDKKQTQTSSYTKKRTK